MKIAITLDGIISQTPWQHNSSDDDLYCLNQVAMEDAWYAVNRWFSQNHDIYLVTSRSNQEMTERWLDEWSIVYNRVFYDIPIHYHYNAAVAAGCDFFITPSLEELPRHGTHELPTYFYHQGTVSQKIPDGIFKISNLSDIDEVIKSWPHPPRKSSVIIVGQSRTLPT